MLSSSNAKSLEFYFIQQLLTIEADIFNQLPKFYPTL